MVKMNPLAKNIHQVKSKTSNKTLLATLEKKAYNFQNNSPQKSPINH